MKVLLRWLAIAVYLLFLASALYYGPRTSAWYAGLGLALATVPFWFVARRQLGASFSVRPTAHERVTTGVYAKIRHLVYVFGVLSATFGPAYTAYRSKTWF